MSNPNPLHLTFDSHTRRHSNKAPPPSHFSVLILSSSPSTFSMRHPPASPRSTRPCVECPSLHGVLRSKERTLASQIRPETPSNGASNRGRMSSVEMRLKSIRACSCCLMIRACSCCLHQRTTRFIYKFNVYVQRASVLVHWSLLLLLSSRSVCY
jgi:hypothetical protein